MSRPGRRWPALVLLTLGVSWAIYYLLAKTAELGSAAEGSRWLLPALSLALVVLTLGLGGVLIRNLVKLIVERKRGILGSRLRIKLVFFFLALVLLPTIVLFYGSATVIKQTVEAILRTPLEHLTRGSQIADLWTDFFQAESLQRAQALAGEIERADLLDPLQREQLAELLQRRQREQELLSILVVENGTLVARAEEGLRPDLRPLLAELIDSVAAEAVEDGAPVSRIGNLGPGLLAHAAVPLGPGDATVAVGMVLPTRIAGTAQEIHSASQDYKQFRAHRRELVRFYVTLIGLIFLATLFVATWIGFYLARRITEPIREVSAAAREISVGNLDVRVRTRIGDEMGMLVEAFNEMAAELEENREVITRSTADLRQSNRALDARRRYIETLVANLSTAVISLDPSGRVSTANPAVQKILGVTLTPGDDARSELGRPGLEPLGELLTEVLSAAGESVRRDLELPGTAPATHISVQVSPLSGRAGEDLGTLIMVEDLSDLLRAQKAQAWREVARRVAHEIKNPLTPIQLAAQRLRKKFFAGSDDLDRVLLEATASIEHEVGGLKQLVDEFSRFARMPEVRPEPVELGKVVESVLTLYQGLPEIDWSVEIDPQVGWVRVDARQMRRALMNLIDNAVAAVNGRGAIRVVTRAGAAKGSVHIEIADSGPGIPPGDRDKMFVPYFSTKKRGTGLGLAIVHRVVTDHRGTIRVEDNAPSGARFVIELPA